MNASNHCINAWLTDMELYLPPARPTQHKQTCNEASMNGDLSITRKPSIIRQYTNDHLLESHSAGASMYTHTHT